MLPCFGVKIPNICIQILGAHLLLINALFKEVINNIGYYKGMTLYDWIQTFLSTVLPLYIA